MDTSIEYIKMCEEARVELVLFYKDKRRSGTSNKNFYKYDEVEMNFHKTSEQVWLPRLDQLVDMWYNWNHKYSMAFFEEMVINSKFHPVQISNCPAYDKHLCCDSLEKHLLHRIMWGKYHKIWDIEKQVWYTIEERLTPEQKAEDQRKDEEFQQFIDDHPPMDTI